MKTTFFSKKIVAFILATTLSVTACTTPDNTASSNTPNHTFRYSLAEMQDIANPNKLSFRIFYDQPSEGPDAAWFDAIKHGDLTTVKQMVENGQNLEAKDEASLGQTALGWAAFIGYEDIVDYLIEHGANLHATDRGDVYHVLKSAVLGKNTNIVRKVYKLLGTTQADLNNQTIENDGETLLMVAASNNRIDTVKFLLSEGADPNLVTTTQNQTLGAYNQSALSYACTRGHKEMQQLLISIHAINHRTGQSNC